MDAYGWFTAIITNWFSPIRIVGGMSLTGASMGVYSAAANSASESVSGRHKSGEPKLLLLRLALFPEKTQSDQRTERLVFFHPGSLSSEWGFRAPTGPAAPTELIPTASGLGAYHLGRGAPACSISPNPPSPRRSHIA